ncbi:hypothetical protein, partial [Klebsiella quasipneumoniae]|uniref:hypothetical protein n=1 Tax=Klebsiella quasipneumoniae TaxID=1463165 RepID=UPI002ABB93BB
TRKKETSADLPVTMAAANATKIRDPFACEKSCSSTIRMGSQSFAVPSANATAKTIAPLTNTTGYPGQS